MIYWVEYFLVFVLVNDFIVVAIFVLQHKIRSSRPIIRFCLRSVIHPFFIQTTPLTYFDLMLYFIHQRKIRIEMIFIETPIFTEDVKELLSDDEYAELQKYLVDNPLAGDVIQQTGGLRKVRWSSQGKGKRGGVRVIYYYVTPASQIRFLLIYKKGVQDDLTVDQKKTLRQLNERW